MAKKEYFVYKQGSVNGQILMNAHVFSSIAYSILTSIDGIVVDNQKDVECTINDNDVSFEVKLNVKYGKSINRLTEDAQKKINEAIQQYTGVQVSNINIDVNNIEF